MLPKKLAGEKVSSRTTASASRTPKSCSHPAATHRRAGQAPVMRSHFFPPFGSDWSRCPAGKLPAVSGGTSGAGGLVDPLGAGPLLNPASW